MTEELEVTEPVETEIDSLKKRADQMGIAYHPAIGVAKLKAKIEAELSDESDEPEEEVQEIVTEAPKETVAQKRMRLRNEANKLVRIRLSCNNPAKNAWPGEIVSVSNRSIGTIKKFIPFDAEEGWHVPAIILTELQERTYLKFYKKKINSKDHKKTKNVKEFNIEILPNLTQAELKELAKIQALTEAEE